MQRRCTRPSHAVTMNRSEVLVDCVPRIHTETRERTGSGAARGAGWFPTVLLIVLAAPRAAPALQSRDAFDGMPSWSPDGSSIVFHSDRAGNFDIWIMDGDGGNPRPLTEGRGHDFIPRWSPDGSRIVFYSDRQGNVFIDHNDLDVYVMNADGSDQTPITDAPGRDMLADWSADGARIAFVSDRAGPYDIFLMDADGANPVNLTDNSVEVYNPSFSPNGDRIVFDAPVLEHDDRYDIFTMRPDGSGVVNLTASADGHDFNARWSPDGRRLAFMSSRDGNFEIYVMNSDGSDQRRLTDQGENDHDPSWSPDGRRIVFMSRRDGNPEIYVMNADGSDQRRLTDR